MTLKNNNHIWYLIYLIGIGIITVLLILLKGDAIQEWFFPRHLSLSMSVMGQLVVMAIIVLAVEAAAVFGHKLIRRR